MTTKWKYSPEEIFAAGPVVPVLVINDVEKAVPLAKALMEGGIKVLEVTLRTPAAIDVIKRIAQEVPDSLIGAGTVTNAQQLKAVVEAGAKFAISPGMTADLLKAGMDSEIPLIPGISSTSDLMRVKMRVIPTRNSSQQRLQVALKPLSQSVVLSLM